MSYRKIPEIVKSPKAQKGRLYQYIGKNRVKKYAFSPYTAKSKERYRFYAEVTLLEEIESPPGSGKKISHFTIPVVFGTFLEFRDEVLNGDVMEKINAVVGLKGGVVQSVSYHRGHPLESPDDYESED